MDCNTSRTFMEQKQLLPLTSLNFDSGTPTMKNARLRIGFQRGLFLNSRAHDDFSDAQHVLDRDAYSDFDARKAILNNRNDSSQNNFTNRFQKKVAESSPMQIFAETARINPVKAIH